MREKCDLFHNAFKCNFLHIFLSGGCDPSQQYKILDSSHNGELL